MKTLLDMTQDILSTLDSDAVNSISDTYEALQVVGIIKNVYLDIVTEYNLPSTHKLSYLESVSDVTRPTHLHIPDEAKKVVWWKYDVRSEIADKKNYQDLVFLDPEAFVELCNQRDSLDTTNNQIVTLESNVTLVVSKVDPPHYWTSFDNDMIVCDAYDSTVDSSLQQSKTQAYLDYGPTFTIDDSFVPSLPENLEQLFYRTAENTAYQLFKQAVNPKLDRKEHDLRIRAQRNKEKLTNKDNKSSSYPNYGRR
jgi:hypothetical protein